MIVLPRIFLPRILRVDEIPGNLSVPSRKERERITDKGRWRERILMYTFHLESSLRRDIFAFDLDDEVVSYSRYRERESVTKVHPVKLLTRKSTLRFEDGDHCEFTSVRLSVPRPSYA